MADVVADDGYVGSWAVGLLVVYESADLYSSSIGLCVCTDVDYCVAGYGAAGGVGVCGGGGYCCFEGWSILG